METERALANAPSLGKERLLRILGVTFGVAVGIGGTIGIGILRIPGSVAAQLGHSGLIMVVWIVCGLYAFAGANTYAELGTMLPLDGGRTFTLVALTVSLVDFLSAGPIGSSAPVRWRIWWLR